MVSVPASCVAGLRLIQDTEPVVSACVAGLRLIEDTELLNCVSYKY